MTDWHDDPLCYEREAEREAGYDAMPTDAGFHPSDALDANERAAADASWIAKTPAERAAYHALLLRSLVPCEPDQHRRNEHGYCRLCGADLRGKDAA